MYHHTVKLEKEIKVEMDKSDLPRGIKDILQKLRKEGVAIIGGVARYLLLEELMRQGRKISFTQLRQESDIKDVDIKIWRFDSLPNSEEAVIQKCRDIRKLLGKVYFELDFDDMRAAVKDGVIFEKSIISLLSDMDLTSHEVALIPKKGKWYLYYTTRCLYDTIGKVKRLCPKNGFVIRKRGIAFFNGSAWYRLFKACLFNKELKIVLPEWQLKNLWQQKKDKKGLFIGKYALVLIKKIEKNKVAQVRLMELLYHLGLTNAEENFLDWAAAQELGCFFENKNFLFGNISDSEKVRNKVKRIRDGEDRCKEKQKKRAKCKHKYVAKTCSLCPRKCRIEVCSCGETKIPFNLDLPCNIALTLGKNLSEQKVVVLDRVRLRTGKVVYKRWTYAASSRKNMPARKPIQRIPLRIPVTRKKTWTGLSAKHI